MAATIVTRAGQIAQRIQGKVIEVAAIALEPNGTARTRPEDLVTWSTGNGAPTEAAADGSVYTDVDGTDGDDSLYVRIAGAWVAIQGETT